MKAVAVQASHEHEFEAVAGLPEALPAGERVLWQGSPDWRALARDAFHLQGVAGYFAAILLVRGGFVFMETASAWSSLRAMLLLAPVFGFALGMLALLAWLSARTTVYTVTTRRVVMRVGIVLTLTFNLPLKRLGSAGLRLHARDGTGDIPLQLASDKIAFVHLWPHVRPWRLARPEPMLRSVPGAARVAQRLGEAWAAESGAALAPAAAPVRADAPTSHELQTA